MKSAAAQRSAELMADFEQQLASESLLRTSMQLAGGDAETASRTLERLGKNISLAIGTPSSEAASCILSEPRAWCWQ